MQVHDIIIVGWPNDFPLPEHKNVWSFAEKNEKLAADRQKIIEDIYTLVAANLRTKRISNIYYVIKVINQVLLKNCFKQDVYIL